MGRNPLLPLNICIPDAEAHVMPDGKVYLYGSLDKELSGYCSDSYRVASSSDMKSWEVHPVSFTSDRVPWAGETSSKAHSSLSGVTCFDELPAHIRKFIPEEMRETPIEQIIASIEENARQGLPKDLRLYAPDAIEKDGRYYLYFCMSDDSEGVAVADSPQGPFGEPKRLAVQGIDPAVFVDDDGQAYYYWGQFQANAARLSPDMMTLEKDSIVEGIVTEREHHFHEGSSMRKRNGIYYYVFADISRGKATCLGYATSTSPLGPFTYQGVIIDNADCDPGSWNNHGSIEEINGQWYVFYHRSSNHTQYLRRVCVEPITFDENGLIQEVPMTSQGAGEPFVPGEWIPAYSACGFFDGAYLDTIGSELDGAVRFQKNSEAVFRYFHNEQPVHTLEIRGCGAAVFRLEADGVLVGEGKAGEVIPISLEAGTHELRVKMLTDGKYELHFLRLT